MLDDKDYVELKRRGLPRERPSQRDRNLVLVVLTDAFYEGQTQRTGKNKFMVFEETSCDSFGKQLGREERYLVIDDALNRFLTRLDKAWSEWDKNTPIASYKN